MNHNTNDQQDRQELIDTSQQDTLSDDYFYNQFLVLYILHDYLTALHKFNSIPYSYAQQCIDQINKQQFRLARDRYLGP